MQSRRVQSAVSRSRQGSLEKSLTRKSNGLSEKINKRVSSMPQNSEQKYFSGLEITNIFLIEPPKKKLKNNKKTNSDVDYKPIDYLNYIKTNFDRFLIDRSFEKPGTEFNIFKTGKLRTGLACRRFKSSTRKDSLNLRFN